MADVRETAKTSERGVCNASVLGPQGVEVLHVSVSVVPASVVVSVVDHESYEQTVRPSPATRGLRDAETVRRSETRAAAAAAAAARKLRNDEGSDLDATYASSYYASPPPAVVDPFVSAFVSAMRDDEDDDQTDNPSLLHI